MTKKQRQAITQAAHKRALAAKIAQPEILQVEGPDLYEIAEEIQRANPKYKNSYFEDRSFGGKWALWFDTSPAELFIVPRANGTYDVMFSWPYQTMWDETESIEVEMGTYKTPKGAVRRAFELSLLSDDAIRSLFEPGAY